MNYYEVNEQNCFQDGNVIIANETVIHYSLQTYAYCNNLNNTSLIFIILCRLISTEVNVTIQARILTGNYLYLY